MLQIAIPNKGSLSEDAVTLVRDAGYSCRRDDKALAVRDVDNDVEFIFLRPRDIAIYVSQGVLEIGITGRDLALDSEANVVELLALGFGKSRFCYALPRPSDLMPDQFQGLRIATSYPNIVHHDMTKRGVAAEIVRLDGAVEISVRLGVADAIADVVQSGKTLEQAGLAIVGEPVLQSEAVVIGRNPTVAATAGVAMFLKRLQGIIVAREYVMVEYDCRKAVLQQACAITPGIESPTIAPLSEPDWVAVKAMAKKKQVNPIMDQLAELGARGILITDIRTCRI